MDPTEHRAAIVEQGTALASVPASGLDAPVPSCPGWTVARVISHTGRIHVWATSFIAQGPDGGPADAGPRPPEGDAILAWYREALDGLVAELDRHDPSEPSMAFTGPAPVAFWFRRQAHEVAVHRWDAQAALGDPGPIPADLASDGIDEWFDLWAQRSVVDKGRGVPDELVGATLHVHCTDVAGEWLLRLTAEGPTFERAHAKGDAALRGPASDLLLALWHRIPLADVDVVGDADRAAAILDLVHIT